MLKMNRQPRMWLPTMVVRAGRRVDDDDGGEVEQEQAQVQIDQVEAARVAPHALDVDQGERQREQHRDRGEIAAQEGAGGAGAEQGMVEEEAGEQHEEAGDHQPLLAPGARRAALPGGVAQ